MTENTANETQTAPVAGQCRWRSEKDWSLCTAEHVRMVLNDQRYAAEGYEVRYLYTAPQAQPADALDVEAAIEELSQLGYTFKAGQLIPPDHVGELIAVVQSASCGCRVGECETKANQACRMTAEIREQAEPVSYEFQDREGKWCAFANEEHRRNTEADGTWPIRALCPERGKKPSRYVPAVATDVSKTFEKFRRLQSIHLRKDHKP